MWVTPDVIDAEQFTHRRLRGGYDEAEVDDFLDLVAGHVGEMQDYIDRLEAELEEARHGAACQDHGSAGLRAHPDLPGRHRGEVSLLVPGLPGHDQGREVPVVAEHVDHRGDVGPYAELSPDRLDATNGGRPTNVPRPEEVMPLGSGRDAPRPERQLENVPRPGREVTAGPVSGPRRESEDRAGPGHPFDPIASWQLPAFVPLRTLADEIAEDAERYLHDEARRAEARKESSTWRTAMELERAEWCRRVGLDANPIEWSSG